MTKESPASVSLWPCCQKHSYSQDRQSGTEIIFLFVLLHFIKIVVLKLEDLRGIMSCLRKRFHSLEKQRNLGRGRA